MKPVHRPYRLRLSCSLLAALAAGPLAAGAVMAQPVVTCHFDPTGYWPWSTWDYVPPWSCGVIPHNTASTVYDVVLDTLYADGEQHDLLVRDMSPTVRSILVNSPHMFLGVVGNQHLTTTEGLTVENGSCWVPWYSDAPEVQNFGSFSGPVYISTTGVAGVGLSHYALVPMVGEFFDNIHNSGEFYARGYTTIHGDFINGRTGYVYVAAAARWANSSGFENRGVLTLYAPESFECGGLFQNHVGAVVGIRADLLTFGDFQNAGRLSIDQYDSDPTLRASEFTNEASAEWVTEASSRRVIIEADSVLNMSTIGPAIAVDVMAASLANSGTLHAGDIAGTSTSLENSGTLVAETITGPLASLANSGTLSVDSPLDLAGPLTNSGLLDSYAITGAGSVLNSATGRLALDHWDQVIAVPCVNHGTVEGNDLSIESTFENHGFLIAGTLTIAPTASLVNECEVDAYSLELEGALAGSGTVQARYVIARGDGITYAINHVGDLSSLEIINGATVSLPNAVSTHLVMGEGALRVPEITVTRFSQMKLGGEGMVATIEGDVVLEGNISGEAGWSHGTLVLKNGTLSGPGGIQRINRVRLEGVTNYATIDSGTFYNIGTLSIPNSLFNYGTFDMRGITMDLLGVLMNHGTLHLSNTPNPHLLFCYPGSETNMWDDVHLHEIIGVGETASVFVRSGTLRLEYEARNTELVLAGGNLWQDDWTECELTVQEDAVVQSAALRGAVAIAPDRTLELQPLIEEAPIRLWPADAEIALGTIRVAGRSEIGALGNAPGGPTSNGFAQFAYGNLQLAGPFTHTLVSAWGRPVGLWCYGLAIEPDATLDLAGGTVYYIPEGIVIDGVAGRGFVNQGTFINGEIRPFPAPCDVNIDAVCALDDLQRYAACLSGPNVPLTAACNTADADRDGDVDLGDFALFQAAY